MTAIRRSQNRGLFTQKAAQGRGIVAFVSDQIAHSV
jgi:hypothetical protein